MRSSLPAWFDDGRPSKPTAASASSPVRGDRSGGGERRLAVRSDALHLLADRLRLGLDVIAVQQGPDSRRKRLRAIGDHLRLGLRAGGLSLGLVGLGTGLVLLGLGLILLGLGLILRRLGLLGVGLGLLLLGLRLVLLGLGLVGLLLSLGRLLLCRVGLLLRLRRLGFRVLGRLLGVAGLVVGEPELLLQRAEGGLGADDQLALRRVGLVELVLRGVEIGLLRRAPDRERDHRDAEAHRHPQPPVA